VKATWTFCRAVLSHIQEISLPIHSPLVLLLKLHTKTIQLEGEIQARSLACQTHVRESSHQRLELPLIFAIVTQPSPAFGTITDYPFNDTLNSPSITSITIETVFTENINLNIFILPSQSFVNAAGNQFVLRAAVSNLISPTTQSPPMLFLKHPETNQPSSHLVVNFTLSCWNTIDSNLVLRHATAK
jgi:hypothetical protein